MAYFMKLDIGPAHGWGYPGSCAIEPWDGALSYDPGKVVVEAYLEGLLAQQFRHAAGDVHFLWEQYGPGGW